MDLDCFVFRRRFEEQNVVLTNLDNREWAFPNGSKLLVWNVLINWKRCEHLISNFKTACFGLGIEMFRVCLSRFFIILKHKFVSVLHSSKCVC